MRSDDEERALLIKNGSLHERFQMIVEIAIAARDLPQAKEGDIVVARIPKGGIGRREAGDFIWLLIDTGVPLNDLRGHVTRDTDIPGDPEQAPVRKPPPLSPWHFDPQLFRKWPQYVSAERGERDDLPETELVN
jgi:hypothetical protein